MGYKMIRIPYNGPILAKGGVYGPISTPYRETIQNIGTLLMTNIPVIEVLGGGKEVALTLKNFENDNSVEEKVEVHVPLVDEEAERLAKQKAEEDRINKEMEEELLAKLIKDEEDQKKQADEAAKQQAQQQQQKQQNPNKQNSKGSDAVAK